MLKPGASKRNSMNLKKDSAKKTLQLSKLVAENCSYLLRCGDRNTYVKNVFSRHFSFTDARKTAPLK